jgi:hypothetical protein
MARRDGSRVRAAALAVAVLSVTEGGCKPVGYRARFAKTKEEAERSADFLKCHTRDGRVYVLARWTFDESSVRGEGRHYDAQRNLVSEGPQTIPLSNVALFETNIPETIPRSSVGYVVMGVVSVASLAVTAYCIANPKACFGSCPTFYVHDGEAWKPGTELTPVAARATGTRASRHPSKPRAVRWRRR